MFRSTPTNIAAVVIFVILSLSAVLTAAPVRANDNPPPRPANGTIFDHKPTLSELGATSKNVKPSLQAVTPVVHSSPLITVTDTYTNGIRTVDVLFSQKEITATEMFAIYMDASVFADNNVNCWLNNGSEDLPMWMYPYINDTFEGITFTYFVSSDYAGKPFTANCSSQSKTGQAWLPLAVRVEVSADFSGTGYESIELPALITAKQTFLAHIAK
jgi:hypothetical protein